MCVCFSVKRTSQISLNVLLPIDVFCVIEVNMILATNLNTNTLIEAMHTHYQVLLEALNSTHTIKIDLKTVMILEHTNNADT